MPAGTAVVGSAGGGSAVNPSRSMPAPNLTVDQRLAELERRSTQLMESVLDILRGQAEDITRICLEEFRQQVEALVQDSETRLRQGVQHSFEESAATLISLRSDLMEKMAARGAQLTRSLEDAVRTRLRSQLGGEEKPAPDKPPSPVEGE